MSLNVVAVITAQAEHREAVLNALLAMLVPTRAENACLKYELSVDESNPNRFVMIECWADAAGLDAHMQTAHMDQLKLALAEKIEGLQISRLNPIA